MATDAKERTAPAEDAGRGRHATLAAALAAAQAEMAAPAKTREANTGTYSYRYADLADIYDAVRGPLSRHGLSLSSALGLAGEVLVYRTTLLHADSDQTLASEAPVPKWLRPQELGSHVTYLTRYQVCALVGLAAQDDDDGRAAEQGHARERGREQGRAPDVRGQRPAPRGAPPAAANGKGEAAPAASAEELLGRIKRECVTAAPTLDAEAAHWRVLEWVYGTAQADGHIPHTDHEVEWPDIAHAVWGLYQRKRADYQSCLSRSLAELKRVGLG